MGSSFSIFGNNSNTDNDTNINENIGTSKPSLRPTTPILGTIPKILDIPEIIIEECEEDIQEDIREDIQEDIRENIQENIREDDKDTLDINLNLLENNIVAESNTQLDDNNDANGNDENNSDDSDDSESNNELDYEELNKKYDNLDNKYNYLQNEYYSLSKTYLDTKTKILSLEKIVIKLKYIKNKTNNKLELSNLENNMINNKMNTLLNENKSYKNAFDKLNFKFLKLKEESEELKYHHNLIRKKLKSCIDKDVVHNTPFRHRRVSL